MLRACLIAVMMGVCMSATADDDLKKSRARAVAEMQKLLASDAGKIRHFEDGHFAFACLTDEKKLERIQTYATSFLRAISVLFGKPSDIVRVYVFDTKEQVANYRAKVSGDPEQTEPSMGRYHPKTRSVTCSMQWGLGWLGDLLLQSLISDDWSRAKGKPAPWFKPSLVSMLYNCFRRPDGTFCGLNTMSYYRPQAQQLVEAGQQLPLDKFLKGDYTEARAKQGNSIRVQGRNVLAFLHSRGQLISFYKAYRSSWATDPSGISAVEKVTRSKVADFERNWLVWLLSADGEIGTSAMAKPFPVLGILVSRSSSGDRPPGIRIHHPCAGGPAERAGLKAGDRLTAVNGTAVETLVSLIELLAKRQIDDTVTLSVLRGKKKLELRVKLDRVIDG